MIGPGYNSLEIYQLIQNNQGIEVCLMWESTTIGCPPLWYVSDELP